MSFYSIHFLFNYTIRFLRIIKDIFSFSQYFYFFQHFLFKKRLIIYNILFLHLPNEHIFMPCTLRLYVNPFKVNYLYSTCNIMQHAFMQYQGRNMKIIC